MQVGLRFLSQRPASQIPKVFGEVMDFAPKVPFLVVFGCI